jgi:hypothetical protein
MAEASAIEVTAPADVQEAGLGGTPDGSDGSDDVAGAVPDGSGDAAGAVPDGSEDAAGAVPDVPEVPDGADDATPDATPDAPADGADRTGTDEPLATGPVA